MTCHGVDLHLQGRSIINELSMVFFVRRLASGTTFPSIKSEWWGPARITELWCHGKGCSKEGTPSARATGSRASTRTNTCQLGLRHAASGRELRNRRRCSGLFHAPAGGSRANSAELNFGAIVTTFGSRTSDIGQELTEIGRGVPQVGPTPSKVVLVRRDAANIGRTLSSSKQPE